MNTTTQQNKDKIFFRVAMGLSVIVFLAVIVLNKKILPVPKVLPSWTYDLPLANAWINGTCSILLMLSLYFIRRKDVAKHKLINLTTFGLSSIFLLNYVLFHWMAPQTYYPESGPFLFLYRSILISHIVLAAVVLPLILLSFYRGLQMQVDLHKKIVRFSYPIWLYVTLSGVVVYLMISPYYPQ